MTVETARADLWRDVPGGLPFEPVLAVGEQIPALAREFAARGFVVLGPPALDPAVHDALVEESRAQRRVSAWDLAGDGTAGSMAQDNVRAQLGPLARQLMASAALRGFIGAVTGRLVIPGWSATCLTFYDQPGQYIGKHRDKVDACHYALLLYLEAEWPGDVPGPGVQLHIERVDDDPDPVRITARRNRLALVHGSRLTHYRPPLAAGEAVSLVAGCFAVVD